MVKSLTASLVSRDEEERHQRNLNENEQLKKQIAEVISVSYGKLLIKPYFSSLVHFQVRFPGKQGRHFINQIYSVFLFFLHHRAKQAIHLTAFVKVQVSMQE